jgi:3-oxoacyl-[acyl-carrier protein] reductase
MQQEHLDGEDPGVIIFGASGAIGQKISEYYVKKNIKTYGISRSNANKLVENVSALQWSASKKFSISDFDSTKSLSAVIWAQGANCNDNIYDFDENKHLELYQANVISIMSGLNQLLNLGLVGAETRLCIISSIWQDIARQNKLSYTVTKSALRGLVQSLAIDLGPKNILVNAVLPGALDTPMTRANLSIDQIEKLQKDTPLHSLPTFDDVTELVAFLCSRKNTGITGQFIAADRGYSFVRYL